MQDARAMLRKVFDILETSLSILHYLDDLTNLFLAL